MAAKSSNGTGGGNWSATTTWSGGVVPVAGTDTVTIVAGDTVHADTASMTTGKLIVGNSPTSASFTVLTITAGSGNAAALIIDAGVYVQVQGSIVLNGQSTSTYAIASITMAAGSTLSILPPSAKQYTIDFEYNSQLICNGSSGSHCVVKTDLGSSGTASLFFNSVGFVGQNATVNGGLTTATYTDFSNFGTSGANNVGLVSYVISTWGLNTAISITNCTFTACSYWFLADTPLSWDAAYTLSGCIFSSSQTFTSIGGTMAIAFSGGHASATNPKLITGCSFDQPVMFDSTTWLTFTNCVFASGILTNGTPIFPDDTYFNNNFIVHPSNSTALYGSMRDCYSVATASRVPYWAPQTNVTLTGVVFEQVAGSVSASTVCVNTTGGNVACYKCFVLGLGGVGTTGPLLVQSVAGHTMTMEHCLVWGDSTGGIGNCGIVLGSVAPHAGDIPSCRSNILFWATAGSTDTLIIENPNTYVLDVCTAVGYNNSVLPYSGACKYNAGATTASVANYYGLEVTDSHSFASGLNAQLSKGDFIANPNFTDQTFRGIIGWANRTQGQANTWAATIAYLQANPSLVPTAIQWVRAGYVPTNIALKNATYPGDAMTTDANGNALNGTVGPMGYPSASNGGAAMSAAM